MSHTRYLMHKVAYCTEVEVFMMPGIMFGTDAVYLCGMSFSKLAFEDWYMLEKSQFADDLEQYMIGGGPYFCIFSSNYAHASEEQAKYRTMDRAYQLGIFISTLRLLYPGDIALSSDYIIYTRRADGTNVRNPSRFGRNAYDYEVSLSIENADFGKIENVFYSLKFFHDNRNNLPVSSACRLFDLSYDPALIGNTPRYLYLLSAMEALIGDETDLLATLPWPTDDMNSFCKAYKNFRRPLAHGKAEENDIHLEAFRSVLRILISDAIAHELKYPYAGDATDEALMDRLKQDIHAGQNPLMDVSVAYQPL